MKLAKRRYDIQYKNNYYKLHHSGHWLIFGNESLYPVTDKNIARILWQIWEELEV